MADGATAGASRENRTAIPVSCALHRGPRGFANLVVEKQGSEIVLDPHVCDWRVRDHFRRRCRDGPVRGSPQVAPPVSATPAPPRPEPAGERQPVGITPRWGLSSLDWHTHESGTGTLPTLQPPPWGHSPDNHVDF